MTQEPCEPGCPASRRPFRSDDPPWVLPQTEVLLVLEGQVRIEVAGGPTLELKPGDMASLPKGAVTRWHITPPFREMWFLADQ